MAKMSDLARAMAASQGAGMSGPGDALGIGPDDTSAVPPDGVSESPSGGGTVDDALNQVEAAISGLPSDVAEQIRSHLNAIRDLAATGEAAGPGEREATDSGGTDTDSSTEPNPETMNQYPKGS